jgi:hypothetical protein
LLDNTDASMWLQKNDARVSNSEFSDHKNSKELPNCLHPLKTAKKAGSLKEHRFLWT